MVRPEGLDGAVRGCKCIFKQARRKSCPFSTCQVLASCGSLIRYQGSGLPVHRLPGSGLVIRGADLAGPRGRLTYMVISPMVADQVKTNLTHRMISGII